MATSAGQYLINQALPKDLRDYSRTLDKKNVSKLFQEVAEKHPEKYADIAKKLSDIGRYAAYYSGGDSVGLRDLIASDNVQQLKQRWKDRILQEEAAIPDQEARKAKVLELMMKARAELVPAVLEDAKKRDNPLYRQLAGAGKGNPNTLNSLLGGDVAYVDHRNEAIPFPVMNSYADGLSFSEYLAASFGVRKSLYDLKSGTADAGYLAKQLTQVAHRLVATKQDDDRPFDETRPTGFPVDIEDADNEGARLAVTTAGYPRNTLLTPGVISDLKKAGIKNLLIRSPMVGGAPDGGVFAKDLGWREKGVTPVGDFAGMASAAALAEPVTQSLISSKHSGGVAGAQAKSVVGFRAVEALVNPSDKFNGFASHSQVDGRVRDIQAAPQGGWYVTVDDKQHYVHNDQRPTVKVGDTVEAGDAMSDGLVNPSELVKHKGIGEGRKAFVKAFTALIKDSSPDTSRRNVELLGRGLIDHVQLTDEFGSYGPDDTVPYSWLERNWQLRDDAKDYDLDDAVGTYLEKPILHYSLGTKVRPSVVKQLKEYGIKNVTANKNPLPFQPTMVRGIAQMSKDPDWQTRMLGGFQERGLLEAAHRGSVSDAAGSSFVPGLVAGVRLDDAPATTGWNPADVPTIPKAQAISNDHLSVGLKSPVL